MNEITTRILDYLVLLFAVVLASSIIYHLMFEQDYETETAIYAEVSNVETFQGVYVRHEEEQTYSGSGAVRYCVSDGAKLGVGSVIAEVYSSGEQIDLRRQIAEKEAELAVLSKIENPGTKENAQPANLSALIEEQYKNMVRFRELGNYPSMLESKQEITVMMSTYEKVTNQNLDFSERISALLGEIDQLSLRLEAPDETIRSPKSAYFVSYVDGYENTLKPENKEKLTRDELAQIRDEGPIDAQTDSHVIGKLVTGYEWYIVGVFDNTKLRLSDGDSVTLHLESVSEPLHGEVETLISAGNITETQIIIRCETMSYDVVQHRTERVEIVRNSVEGVKVPRSAIRFKELTETVEDEFGNQTEVTDNYRGVYVLVGENPEFRKLDIVYETDDYYLSSLNAGSSYVSLYDDIIVNGVMADGN